MVFFGAGAIIVQVTTSITPNFQLGSITTKRISHGSIRRALGFIEYI